MDIFYSYPLYALIVANAILLFSAAVLILRFERLLKQNRSFSGSPTGLPARADNDPHGVRSGFLERRLAMIHNQIKELAKQKVPATATQPSELPLEYAARMVKHGASVDDLTRTCGLNKAEAQLMWRLHANRRLRHIDHARVGSHPTRETASHPPLPHKHDYRRPPRAAESP